MKSRIVVLSLLSMILGCTPESEESSNAISGEYVSHQDDLEAIKAMGFSVEGIQTFESHYIVEGDISIEKIDLRKSSNIAARTAQRFEPGLVSRDNARQISVRLDVPLPSDELPRALQLLNSTNAQANFHAVQSGSADIVISGTNEASCCGGLTTYLAYAVFPKDGKPGNIIKIRDNWHVNMTKPQRIHMLMHELGHCIGLQHTDQYFGSHIPGTPNASDNFSFMNKDISNFTDLSSWDYFSINYLYPTDKTYYIEPNFYVYMYDDIRNAFGSDYNAAVWHFNTTGIDELRQGSVIFSSNYYLQKYPDLLGAFGWSGRKALNHWHQHGVYENRQASPAFDISYYRSQNPDLASMNNSQLLDHYIRNGIYEGRRASPYFNPKVYLAMNASVSAELGSNNYAFAAYHWLKYGRALGLICK